MPIFFFEIHNGVPVRDPTGLHFKSDLVAIPPPQVHRQLIPKRRASENPIRVDDVTDYGDSAFNCLQASSQA
jgi:hypothetical protein